MEKQEQIDIFLRSEAFGVVGASADPKKYGHKVLKAYIRKGLKAVPVNPKEKEIEEIPCVPSVLDLPPEVESISVITPPRITEEVVEMAARKNIRNIWMQPGSESEEAVAACRRSNINVIADGRCILVAFGDNR
jgi:predicted CoA-binding protein